MSASDRSLGVSLTRGGFTYSLLARVGIVPGGRPGTAVRALLAVAAIWLPMAVLSIKEGVAWGHAVEVPFLLDLSIYARFLIAVPLLIISGSFVDRFLAPAIDSIVESGVVPASARAGFDAALARLGRRRDAALPEILLLVLSFGLSLATSHAPALRSVTSWTEWGDGPDWKPTLAGEWLYFVAMPLCTFLLLRWLWRLGFWTRFLWDISRLELTLIPTHPDGAGGLGILGEAHTAFGPLLAALGVIIAARGTFLIKFGAFSLDAAKGPFVAFLILGLLLVFAPLFVFFPKLVWAKKRGLLEYGDLATSYVRSFDEKWLRGGAGPDDQLLGSGDVQSLADIGGSFERVRVMRPVPMELRHVIVVALWMVLPMVPFVATVIPLKVMLDRLLSLATSAR